MFKIFIITFKISNNIFKICSEFYKFFSKHYISYFFKMFYIFTNKFEI